MIAMVCVVALVAALFVARRLSLFSVELGPECERLFKWDEPKIVAELPKEE
jgi:hypothetical protein